MKLGDAFAWRRTLYGLCLTAFAVLMLLQTIEIPGLSSGAGALDRTLLDTRMRSVSYPAAKQVVIVDIDEKSLQQLGRWPWPRSVLADLIKALNQHARVLTLDILFAERDANPADDALLAQAIAAGPTVLGYYLSSDRQAQRAGELPPSVMSDSSLRNLGHGITEWDGFGANLPALQSVATGAGFFNALIDPDGVVRAVPLLARLDGQVYGSMALATLRVALGNAVMRVGQQAIVLQGAKGQVALPLSEGLVSVVPLGMNNGASRFTYISAADVLAGKVDTALIKDKVVLVGSSAPGLTDLRATAVSATLPGVEIHAALIEVALAQAGSQNTMPLLVRAESGRQFVAILTLVLGTILSVLLPMIGLNGILLASLFSGVVILASNAIAFSNLGLIFPLSISLGLVACLALINLALGYLLEGRNKKAVADLFGEYVSPSLVEQMTHDPLRYRLMRSETKELTILFADIRGFTRISETMEPEALREYINGYLTRMTEIIHQHGGTVDKYIGDAVMAFWGAPVDDALHADHAIAASLAMLQACNQLSAQFVARGWPALNIGIGLNSGLCRVGDMGSNMRRAYTVLGDTVNQAARIEGLTKQFGQPLLVGEGTKNLSRTQAFTDLGLVHVAGRQEPVHIYLPTALAVTLPMPRANQTQQDHAAASVGL
jgi:adenylate cyclase